MGRRILLATALGISLAGAARPALAQHAPEIAQGADEVILKDGGMLRGTVVTVEPGRAVTLFVMLTGEQRIVPWAEVERVDRGKHAPKAPAPAPPAAEPSAERERERKARELELAHARGERGVVRVHIESNDPGVQLYRLNTTATPGAPLNGPGPLLPLPHSEVLCIGPCDKVIDGRLGEQFFFGGKDMPSSSTFQVFSRTGALGARVEPGSNGRVIGGLLLDVAGVCTITTGAAVAILGLVDADKQKRNPDGSPMIQANGAIIIERGPLLPGGEVAGPIMIGIGAAALVGGIFLGISGETKYSLSTGASAPAIGLSPTGVSLVF